MSVRARAIKAKADRFVRLCAGDNPGMTSWWASLPAVESLACWAAIDEVAHQMNSEDPTRTLDQCRADALVDLILARTEVATTITIAVPVHTADPGPGPGPGNAAADPTPTPGSTGADPAPTARDDSLTGEDCPAGDDGPAGEQQGCPQPPGFGFATSAQVPGIGVIPGDVVNELLARFDTRVARMLIDARSGTTIESTSTSYRPPEAIRRFVRARDGTCRFPGCGVQARRCDLDHVEAWS